MLTVDAFFLSMNVPLPLSRFRGVRQNFNPTLGYHQSKSTLADRVPSEGPLLLSGPDLLLSGSVTDDIANGKGILSQKKRVRLQGPIATSCLADQDLCRHSTHKHDGPS